MNENMKLSIGSEVRLLFDLQADNPGEEGIPPVGAVGVIFRHIPDSNYEVDFPEYEAGMRWALHPSDVELVEDESASQQPDSAASDEPTYNAQTNWITKPAAEAQREVEDGWQAAEELTHSQALHKLEYVYGVLLTEPREVLAKLQQQAAEIERLRAEVETLKNIGELWTSTNDSRNAVLIENADLHAANRALQEQRDSYQKKYMDVLDDDANLWERVCVAVGHPVRSGNTDELLATIKALQERAEKAEAERNKLFDECVSRNAEIMRLEGELDKQAEERANDVLEVIQERDAAREALKPFADVANQYPRIVDHAAIGVVSGGEAAMPFVTTGPHTMAAYRAAADALK